MYNILFEKYFYLTLGECLRGKVQCNRPESAVIDSICQSNPVAKIFTRTKNIVDIATTAVWRVEYNTNRYPSFWEYAAERIRLRGKVPDLLVFCGDLRLDAVVGARVRRESGVWPWQ